MDKRMLTGVYVNPVERIAEVRTVEDDLDSLYALLDCDLIDITERGIHSITTNETIPVSIICDDEGLLKPDNVPSAFDSDSKPALVGNLFIVAAGADEDGGNISLSQKSAEKVLENAVDYCIKRIGAVYTGIVGVDFI